MRRYTRDGEMERKKEAKNEKEDVDEGLAGQREKESEG
jgi:hypothetical protein